MCLETVDPKPMRKFGVGYKSVEKRGDGTYTCFDHEPNAGKVKYPLDEWIADPKTGRIGYADRLYPTGFHIMLDLPHEASLLRENYRDKEIRVIRVKFRKVVATQILNPNSVYGKQVVAKEIKVIGEC